MENTAVKLDEQALIEEALIKFAALLEDADYATVLEFMGIGRLQFLLRKQMIAELAGLYIALWRLALGRSFPGHADEMFNEFLATYTGTHRGKRGALIVERAREYWAMLQPGGDSDFNNVARHLISFIIKDNRETRSLTLKLALHVRSSYRTIFERLI